MLVRPRGEDQVQLTSEEDHELAIEVMDRKHGIVIYSTKSRVVFKPDGTVDVEKR